jgi:hypothetical protein
MGLDMPAGTLLSQYRVDRVIGRGSAGVVYLARDERLDRAVALKLLVDRRAADAGFRERFLRESRVAAAMEHPHILPIHAAGEAGNDLFIAMRYVQEGDLAGLIARDGPLAAERAAGIVAGVADALDAAHREGLIHRDVKPGNILVDGHDNAYLADFGLAATRGSGGTAFAGTIPYAAPEQIQGGEIDGRADLYALGCVLFECLIGRPPFVRDSQAALLYAHLEEQPPTPSTLRPDLPPALDAVLAQALAKDPEDRYQTGAELVTATSAALQSKRRSRGGLWPALAAILAATAIGGAIVLTFGDGSNHTPTSGPARPLPKSGMWLVDIAESRVINTIPLRGIGGGAIGGGRAWISYSGGIAELDAKTGKQIRRIPVPRHAAWVAYQSGSLWVAPPSTAAANYYIDAIYQVDPNTGHTRRIAVPHSYGAPYAGDGVVFVPGDRRITRINARTGKVSGYLPFGLSQGNLGCAATFTPGSFWIASAVYPNRDVLLRINPRTNRVTKRINLPFSEAGSYCVAAGDGAIWVSGDTTRIWEMDPHTYKPLGWLTTGHSSWLTGTPSALWFNSSRDPTYLHEVNAQRVPLARIQLPFQPLGILTVGNTLWAGFSKEAT